MKKIRYTQVPLNQVTYTCRIADQKARIRMHALSCKEKHVHVGKLIFGPWYLVLGIWTYGFGPWYLVWLHSIDSLWFWTMVLGKAENNKRGKRSLGKGTQGLNIL